MLITRPSTVLMRAITPTHSAFLASSRSGCSRELFAERRDLASKLGRFSFSVEEIVAGLVASISSHVKSVWVRMESQLDRSSHRGGEIIWYLFPSGCLGVS